MDAMLSTEQDNCLDPVLHALPTAREPMVLLQRFRQRLRDTVWGHETPDTLMGPVWSSASSVTRFEARLRALYRAHLKVLHAELTGAAAHGEARRYAELLHVVRRVRNWPVLRHGYPLSPEQLLSADTQRWLFGRPDIVLGERGPMVVETNFDTGIGGYERPDDMWMIAAELFRPAADLVSIGRPMEGFARYFAELADEEPCDVRWIMKDDDQARRELTPLLAYFNQYTARVRHSIHYAGEAVPPESDRPAYLHRACSIYSVNRDRDRFSALLQALWPGVRDCTVPVWLSVLESKLFIAWLSDPAARPASLSADESAAVETLLPWTRVLHLLNEDALEQVLREHEHYILKKSDSYQAKEVHFGCNMSADAWQRLLGEKRAQPTWLDDGPNIWIVQRRVRPRAYDLIEYTDAGPVPKRTGISCCPYLLGGRLRGLETWVMPFTPDLSMIHRMQFVPHFVRAGM
jgi:hypothetical protein